MPKATLKPITLDPATEAARRVVRLLEEINANEFEWFRASTARKAQLERQYQKLAKALSSAEEEISLPATTLAGAMGQVMLAFADAQSITDLADDRYHDDVQIYHQRLGRCLRSVLSVLAHFSGFDPAELGAHHYVDLPADNHQTTFENVPEGWQAEL